MGLIKDALTVARFEGPDDPWVQEAAARRVVAEWSRDYDDEFLINDILGLQ